MRTRKSTPNGAGDKTDVILLISPHFGVVDSWLPILCELKRRRANTSITALIPEPKSVTRIDPCDFVAIQTAKLVDRVIFSGPERQWTETDKFGGLRDFPTEGTKRSTLLLNRAFAQGSKGLPRECKAVLSDVLLSERRIVSDLQKVFSSSVWFSLPHGLDLRTWKIGQKKLAAQGKPRLTKKTPIEGLLEPKVKIYAASEPEAREYRKEYSLASGDVKVIGIPRHCTTWVNYITERAPSHEGVGEGYILVVSRPPSNGAFPEERKAQALKDVRTLAENLGRKIIIRLHPKESDRDRQLYEEIFGAQRGLDWAYSSEHPMLLGRRAFLAITFFSSVAIDMLAVGTPAIERCDFSGLTESPQLVRDAKGLPTSVYQHLGLVLGAKNYEELERQVDRVLNDRAGVVNELRRAYADAYARMDDPIGFVVEEILAVLDG